MSRGLPACVPSCDQSRVGMSMATEAFVYDAIRTPRGKGKKDGSLHSTGRIRRRRTCSEQRDPVRYR